MNEHSAVLMIFKVLEKKSKKCSEDFDFFHLWDADAQGDTCVRIFHRLNNKLANVKWPIVAKMFCDKNIVNEFKLITED